MLFINPATEKFGGFISRYVPVGIPVALGCLAAYLERENIHCRVLNEELVDITPSVLREYLDGMEKPYVIGIHCLTAHVGRAYQIARMCKAQFPDSVVVLGGLHVTALPEEALNTGVVDWVVRGEGEEIMLELYRAIRGDGDPERLLGVSYRRGDTVHNNPEAPLLPSVDDIPTFPYHLFEHPKYDMGFLMTSRGCPYRCSYCSQRLLTGTTYRYRSAAKIADDLELLVDRYKQKAVAFYDDNFCLKASRVHELCDLLVARGLNSRVALSVQTRADNVLLHGGEDLIRHMRVAGFNHMGFGLETGAQRLADLMRKDETVACHLEAAALCQKHGMDVSFFMIFGLPTETAADRLTGFQIVKQAKLVATKYNNMIPYPGTPLWNEVKDSDRVVVTKDWANFNSVLAMTTSIFSKIPLPYVPETCSEWELKRDIIKYNLKSFVNWKSIAAVLGHTKGLGWFMLPRLWYLKPRELFEMSKIGLHVVINIVMTALPLAITEPLMTFLNPALATRRRVQNYNPNSYRIVDWDRIASKQKSVLLRRAQDEQSAHGTIDRSVREKPAFASQKP